VRQGTGLCGSDRAATRSPTVAFVGLPVAFENKLHRSIELFNTIELVQHPPETGEPVRHVRLQLDHLAVGAGSIQVLAECFAALRKAKPCLEGLGPDARQRLE